MGAIVVEAQNQGGQEQSEQLLRRAIEGDLSDFGNLLENYRRPLVRIVAFRMDRRLKSRLDALDVVQEAFIEATQRFEEFKNQPKMPFFLWLRFITIQKLLQLHRHHLGTQMRNAGRDVSIFDSPGGQASSAVLAAKLLGNFTSPTQHFRRAEEQQKLQHALDELSEKDREILVYRHFEQLSMKEAAHLMQTTESGASSRYFRAIEKLRCTLDLET